MPAAVVEDVDDIQNRQVDALQIEQQRQQGGGQPDGDAHQQAGDKAAAIGGWPVQHREHAGKKLQGGDEGGDAQVGEVLFGAQEHIEAVASHDDGGDQQAPSPFQPAIDVALGGRLVQRQYQVVEDHAGERQGHHDDQAAGRRQAADVGNHGQQAIVGGDADAEGEVLGVGWRAEFEAGPEDRRDGQADQQQEQRQAPAGTDHGPRVEVLGEGHVIHVRHDDGRGKEHQQQGTPGAFLQRGVQCFEGDLVLLQPAFQLAQAAKYAVHRIQADAGQGHQLDQRLEGNRKHQAFMLAAGGDMAGTKEDGEQRDQGAEAQGHAVLHRLMGEDAD